MDLSNVGAIIAQLGFPIVICLLMMWYINKSNDQHTEQITELNLQHKQEMHEVTEALNNNTLALQKLTDFLLKGENDV